ncbi:MAG: patatin-like phospholipase family protein [Candidatus Methylomirabilia bacterium]
MRWGCDRHRAVRVGVALGGGGVRGLAHVGVLRAMTEERIPVDLIAGISMGAIVAARFSLMEGLPDQSLIGGLGGLGLSPLPSLAQGPDSNGWWGRLRRLVDLQRFMLDNLLWWGVAHEAKADALLLELTAGKRLEEGRIPLAVVACDLISGTPVVFRTGPARLALRASTALPGFFPPVSHNGQLLADGGLVGMVPTGVVREMGAGLVIAVDADPPHSVPEIRDGLEAFLRVLDICWQHHKECLLREADVVIRPEFGGPIRTLDFSKSGQCVEAGARAAREAVPVIRSLLQDKQPGNLHRWLGTVMRGRRG